MKYVFIGDVHGKVDAVKLALDKGGHKIFVGDFLDSFDRTMPEHEECITLVMDAIEKGEADAIYGNHELSYLLPALHRCSGYSFATEAMLLPHQIRMRRLFKPFIRINEEWLVTHAGLHPKIAAELSDNWDEEFYNLNSPMHWVGRSRGGLRPVGGIFWCDFNDEFEPINGLNQIFGHTRYKAHDIRIKTGEDSINYCIDCLDTQIKFLELDI